MPWFVLYGISDFFSFILQRIVKYRVDVVASNLKIAFPEKSEEERRQIANQFYKQFVDSFLETIKLISISRKSMDKRFSSNIEIFNDLYQTGQSVQIVTGHFFNWEFANLGVSKDSKYPFIVVYMPMSNSFFDQLFKKIRSKFGTILIPATQFRSQFHSINNKGPYALILAADQNPGNTKSAYWVPFFGKPTPFVKGPEKGAKNNNTAQVFVHFYRPKRGYYHMEFTIMTKDPKSYKEGALTKEYVQIVEDKIKQHPADYLWSHRRWKHEFDPTINSLVE
jgi:KDO2-lipid IV(A) lauroyltransferase